MRTIRGAGVIELLPFAWAGGVLLAAGALFWLVSLAKNDVSIVDSLWSLMFLLSAATYAFLSGAAGPRATLVLVLVGLWAVRLSAHITWRNRGQPGDYRYQQIRHNNEPGFRFKSLYIVFGLLAALAWVISAPLASAISAGGGLTWLDYAGVTLWAVGLFFEAVGDYQLARFKSQPDSAGRVMDRGLWRYTRHPNYFGDFTVWWGFYLLALPGGGWWTVFAPLLMSVLLLRVSGVSLLEKDIAGRRPAYADYVRRTNAFFPGPPRDLQGAD